ncbi:hypothetical protein C0991_011085 [Blastosporella zonata]|nr:hypothetical protein C0991_011085 [Blastosporella zonata]
MIADRLAARNGRSFSLRDEPEGLSILSSLMGVTQETINHRKLMQELYDKRVLHNLLGSTSALSSTLSLLLISRLNVVPTVAGRPVAQTTLLRRRKCQTSRGQPPPGNLKERIAALQQRNVSGSSSTDRPASPSIPLTPGAAPNSAGLRDKIARFEKKGGVPVPRGRFGLGAPPLAENAPLKRRGELYGNRIPSVKGASGVAGIPLESGRVVSLEGAEGGDFDSDYTPSSPSSPSSPPVPFQGLTPQHTGSIGAITPQYTGSAALTPQYTGNKELVRGTRFSTALGLARKVEAEGNIEAPMRPITREASPAPTSIVEEKSAPETSAPSTSVVEPAEQVEVVASVPTQEASPPASSTNDPAPVSEPVTAPSPPSIILSPSNEPAESLVISAPEVPAPITHVKAPATITTVEAPAATVTLVEPVIVEAPKSKAEPTEIVLPAPKAVTPPIIALTPSTTTTVPKPIESTTNEPSLAPQNTDEGLQDPVSATTTDEDPLTPMGPFTLANAVHDLGKVVANIQDMFPGQISPLAALPPYRPFVIDTPIPSTSKEDKIPLKGKESITNLELKLDAIPAASVPIPRSNARVPATSSVSKSTSSFLTSPRANTRPVSMIETSPSHVAVAHRVVPARGVSILVPPASALPKISIDKYEHFPPTPEAGVSEFGTVSLGHKTSHSFSHAPSTTEQGTSNANSGSFSAVVHKKVTELPSVAPSSSYMNFYSKAPETPAKTPGLPETPISPGYGELAALLHEAALLELTLEQGELPSEAEKREEREQKEKEKRLKEEKEKQAAARAKVEEESKKHATVAKARAKQEATESKVKSSFRNPILRSKSGHKRDASMDSVASKEPVRSKSVLLPFRPLPQPQAPARPPSRQSTTTPSLALGIAPIPERGVACEATPEADTASIQTSPKSPRYFASLRRFASASKTSLVSASHPRDSVSASSEMSSEDSLGIPTPPGNVGESEGGSGFGIGWPSLSPKKSPGRAASFTDKIWNRSRKTSKSSASSAYETIDRLTKSSAAKSAASLIPPLEPMSYTLDVPLIQENNARLPSPGELTSPRRSASLYVPSTSQSPPVYSARPTSSFYTSIPLISETPSALQPVDEDKLTSPTFIPHSTNGPPLQSLDALFSAKPTSPVYTPHLTRAPPEIEVQQAPAQTQTQKHPQSLDASLFSPGVHAPPPRSARHALRRNNHRFPHAPPQPAATHAYPGPPLVLDIGRLDGLHRELDTLAFLRFVPLGAGGDAAPACAPRPPEEL